MERAEKSIQNRINRYRHPRQTWLLYTRPRNLRTESSGGIAAVPYHNSSPSRKGFGATNKTTPTPRGSKGRLAGWPKNRYSRSNQKQRYKSSQPAEADCLSKTQVLAKHSKTTKNVKSTSRTLRRRGGTIICLYPLLSSFDVTRPRVLDSNWHHALTRHIHC